MPIAGACLARRRAPGLLPALAAAQPTRAEEIAEAQADKAANPPVDPPGGSNARWSPCAAPPSSRRAARIRSSIRSTTAAASPPASATASTSATGPILRASRPVLGEALRLGRGPGTSRGHRARPPRSRGHDRRSSTPPRSATTGSDPTTTSPTAPTSVSATPSSAGRRRCARAGRWWSGRASPARSSTSTAARAASRRSTRATTTRRRPASGCRPATRTRALSAAIDWRPAAGYARRGGNYGVTYHRFDRSGGYAFERLDVDLVQHLPLLRETYVLSGHARVQSALHDDAVAVLPDAGAGRRQHPAGLQQLPLPRSPRPAGPGRVPMGPEPARPRHGAVLGRRHRRARVRQARGSGAFAHDVGVGLRLHTPLSTPIRVELAFGADGPKVVFAGKAAF